VPLHFQKAYLSFNYCAGDFPVTESVAGEILSLPMYPQLTSEQQERVAAEVKAFVTKLQLKPAETELGSLVSAERVG
jgi:dTDP-4-amino-4,6-dideoxygalactose transaminase